MKRRNFRRLIISMSLNFMLLTFFSFNGLAAEEYVFERMWPVLEQPWYFNGLADIVVDGQGNVYVADLRNHRIQKFSSSGAFITKWGSEGTGDGKFNFPNGIAIDGKGNVYVADSHNYRIQKFSSSGAFITKWGSEGAGDGEFNDPRGIAIDGQGNVFVADTYNHRIQKFSSSGAFIAKWGSKGTGDGQFDRPNGIAIDGQDNVYVADWGNDRIQKFSSSGAFIAKWGSEGTGDGEFDCPSGIAIDGQGNVYVGDINNRIQKFSSSGAFITKWGREGTGNGEFDFPHAIAIDGQGNVYVADLGNNRIQKFSSSGAFITKFGTFGSEPGLLNDALAIAINQNGKIYVGDGYNKRIQIFSPSTAVTTRKAIILAGSGPYPGNNLWDATQLCASYAHRALTYQGYTKDAIYYLSADTDLDLDADGIPEVDADATNANFEYAVKTWAKDADNLFIYIVGHGGEGTFRMREFELLYATDFDAWLDTAQQTIPGFVAIVYDGCHSGSFLPLLTPIAGKERIVVASAASSESAIFQGEGTLSFGFQFFAYLFYGGSFYDNFLHGRDSVEATYADKQTPQLDGNGNGIGNEGKPDQEPARAVKMGNQTVTAEDIPAIESVSPSQTLAEGTTSALIYAQNVIDANDIERVFAVIKPPNYSNGSADNPVNDLPEIDLKTVGGNRYEGTYTNFTTEGTYNIAIFARDRRTVLSLPKQTTVTAVGSQVSQCSECSNSPVILTGVTFDSNTACECSDNTSITIGPDVTIKSGATVTFKAPRVTIKSGFRAEEGATVRIRRE